MGNTINRKLKLNFLRLEVHIQFDKLWQEGYLTRSEAYKWLQRKFNLSRRKAHMSRICSTNKLRAILVESVLLLDFFNKNKQAYICIFTCNKKDCSKCTYL